MDDEYEGMAKETKAKRNQRFGGQGLRMHLTRAGAGAEVGICDKLRLCKHKFLRFLMSARCSVVCVIKFSIRERE